MSTSKVVAQVVEFKGRLAIKDYERDRYVCIAMEGQLLEDYGFPEVTKKVGIFDEVEGIIVSNEFFVCSILAKCKGLSFDGKPVLTYSIPDIDTGYVDVWFTLKNSEAGYFGGTSPQEIYPL